MKVPRRIYPSLVSEILVSFPHLDTEQGVVFPTLRFVHVEVGRHDVEVAYEHERYLESEKLRRILVKTPEAAELVVKLRARVCVAVRQVEASEHGAVDDRLYVPALLVFRFARQTLPSEVGLWQAAPLRFRF